MTAAGGVLCNVCDRGVGPSTVEHTSHMDTRDVLQSVIFRRRVILAYHDHTADRGVKTYSSAACNPIFVVR